MKKILRDPLFYIAILIFALALFLIATEKAEAAFDFSLKYGSKGDAVIELQEFLTDQGVYSGPITGNFYSLTRSGVIKFQQANGITPAAGYFGPISRAKAVELLSLKSEEEQEISETGTTTPIIIPVGAPTAPVTPVIPPAPELKPVVPIPTVFVKLEVNANKSEVVGANCETATYKVSVIDDRGVSWFNEIVTMTAPHDTQTLKTVNERTGNGLETYAIFQYLTPATNDTEIIRFTSGNLSAESVLHVRNGLYGKSPEQLAQSGARYDPNTMLCV